VEGSWTNFAGEFYTTAELAGTNGLISYDSRKTDPIRMMTVPGVKAQVGPTAVNPYVLELRDMVEAITKDRPPLVTALDAYRTLELALAAIESAHTGQVVEL
jgi:predicted dehydrogenase